MSPTTYGFTVSSPDGQAAGGGTENAMRVSEMKVRGESGRTAVIRREDDDVNITVEIGGPGAPTVHSASRNEIDQMWLTAQRVQQEMDGFWGGPEDIHRYFVCLETVA